MARKVKVNENLFRTFGIASASVGNLQIRSTLMIELAKFIEQRGMTHVRAADFFGVSQPYISDLMNGRVDRVSIDKLVTMLDRAGQSVTVKVGNKPGRRRSASLTQ